MVGQEAISGVAVDQRVIGEPLDGAALGAGAAEGIPDWYQVRILAVELVLGPGEGSLALDGPGQPAGAWSGSGWLVGEDGAEPAHDAGEVGQVLAVERLTEGSLQEVVVALACFSGQ